MTRSRRTAGWAIAACAAMVLSATAPAQADPNGSGGNGDNGKHLGNSDVRNVGPDYNHGKALRLMQKASAKARQQARQQKPSGRDKVGDTKTWLALDDINGIYLKSYTLRGIGDHIQVWVADDRAFPAGDCRNSLGLTDITDAQVDSFVHEFDTNIYPTESTAFSVAPDRNGKNARTDLMGLPNNYYQTPDKKGADDTVVLVDNVRDANFYDPSSPDGQTYIAGFFYSVFNTYTDRNIMTIDAYDWLHRTGTNPPDDSAKPDYQACPYASGAPRPHLYEGTFAHEYQHLLEHYQDPDEASWVNEGLSDYAQTMVGYVDPSTSVTDPRADSHIACFSGFLANRGYGGPENSLTSWGDQGDPEILCDYGAAYSFMQYLYGHYGEAFLSQLHREPGNGLDGLQAVLDANGSSDSALEVVHRWLATMALDNTLDGGSTLTGGDAATYSEDSLGSQINWDATYGDINHDGTFDDAGNEAYSSPGAPNNGADYVRVNPDLGSLEFSGASSYEPDPMPWTSVTDAPDHGGDAALYSGTGDEVDQSAVLGPVSVSSGDALTFDTRYVTEADWDFFFVQVSTDGGKSWKSLPVDGTTAQADPSAYPTVQANLPGFTGDSGGWVPKSYDLSAYAGQDVLVNFRYITDWATHEAGVWLDNVAVGGNTLLDGTSTSSLRSMTQVNPVPVAGWTVQVVAYGDAGAWLGSLDLQPSGDRVTGALTADQLAAMKAATGTNRTVAALVTSDDPTESARKYARYTLAVDGVEQPGG
ncbi:MAG TPA: choice-of-anchor J domain-containing protein [Marmoricola sp.]|nr:choice-of-anchor J domain-containing protein [Marmoricola sp.]